MGCLLLAESIIVMVSSSRVFIGGNIYWHNWEHCIEAFQRIPMLFQFCSIGPGSLSLFNKVFGFAMFELCFIFIEIPWIFEVDIGLPKIMIRIWYYKPLANTCTLVCIDTWVYKQLKTWVEDMISGWKSCFRLMISVFAHLYDWCATVTALNLL